MAVINSTQKIGAKIFWSKFNLRITAPLDGLIPVAEDISSKNGILIDSCCSLYAGNISHINIGKGSKKNIHIYSNSNIMFFYTL